MNNSGTVVSAPDLASRVLATASVAQTWYRVRSGDRDVRGKVFSWAGQLHNSTLLICESHTTPP